MNWVLHLHGKSCKDHLEEDEITLSLRNCGRRKVEGHGVDMRPRPNAVLQSLNHAFALSWELGGWAAPDSVLPPSLLSPSPASSLFSRLSPRLFHARWRGGRGQGEQFKLVVMEVERRWNL